MHHGGKQSCDICFEEIETKPLIDAMVYPKNNQLCDVCSKRLKPKRFYRHDLSIQTCVLYDYQGFIRQLILRYKVYGDRYLERYLFTYHRYWIRYYYRKFMFVVSPSHACTTNSSKENHLDFLLRNIGLKRSAIEFDNWAPQKQANLSAADRSRIREHIKIRNIPANVYDRILIIDDIVTTGNTLEAIANQLRPYANHVEALCLAGSRPNLK
ncbi:ComF family protein [Erysipelothrix tonsillarum]|uniref:ComF family protein n=1 Tax=Erysipelothrix tonsillarum TaxID=38402 RepID=UPI001FCB76BF|nr:ComF family protein [Erysipelothrix tonsillarum]